MVGVAVNDQMLLKLSENMDVVKEKVIRIEESIKAVGALREEVSDLKEEIGGLKVAHSKMDESNKSAHIRLNELEKKVGNVLFWSSTTIIGGFVVGLISFLFYLAKKGMN